MKITVEQKAEIKRRIVGCLKGEPEIYRIVIFGSFNNVDSPNDLDVAVFQSSNRKYLDLAMSYRLKMESVSRLIAMDVIPIRPNPPPSEFLKEIERGEVIYER